MNFEQAQQQFPEAEQTVSRFILGGGAEIVVTDLILRLFECGQAWHERRLARRLELIGIPERANTYLQQLFEQGRAHEFRCCIELITRLIAEDLDKEGRNEHCTEQ